MGVASGDSPVSVAQTRGADCTWLPDSGRSALLCEGEVIGNSDFLKILVKSFSPDTCSSANMFNEELITKPVTSGVLSYGGLLHRWLLL